MFIAASYTIAKKWKQPKWPLMKEYIDNKSIICICDIIISEDIMYSKVTIINKTVPYI